MGWTSRLQEAYGMKQAIGLGEKRDRGIGAARVAGGRWGKILRWQRLEEQMAPQPEHTHHVGENGASYKVLPLALP